MEFISLKDWCQLVLERRLGREKKSPAIKGKMLKCTQISLATAYLTCLFICALMVFNCFEPDNPMLIWILTYELIFYISKIKIKQFYGQSDRNSTSGAIKLAIKLLIFIALIQKMVQS